MSKEICMTLNEISRVNIFSEISLGKISKTKAAEILCISRGHLHRLYKKFQKEGVQSLVSRQRGKPSNHQLKPIIKARILELVTCELYAGFGPTFMCEKLEQSHQIKVSRETTRQLMIRSEMWKINKQKRPVIHQQRKRRARFGELVQIDGSPHAWLEDRGDPCVLIVFIDDATGLTYGKFFKSETTKAYMVVSREYIIKYGRPLAEYSDKYAVFRVNKPGCLKKECLTQYGRALKELGIELIYANSPQAKGRVERANQTHQDRLVKELRLAGINSMEEANKFLPTYWEKHNKKFAVAPEDNQDAHRKILPEHNLKRIFGYKNYRKVSKNLEIQYKDIIYQIVSKNPAQSLYKAQVTVLEELDGKISIEYQGKVLSYKIFSQQEFKSKIVNSKEIDRFLKEKTKNKSLSTHPWKQKGIHNKKLDSYKAML